MSSITIGMLSSLSSITMWQGGAFALFVNWTLAIEVLEETFEIPIFEDLF